MVLSKSYSGSKYHISASTLIKCIDRAMRSTNCVLQGTQMSNPVLQRGEGEGGVHYPVLTVYDQIKGRPAHTADMLPAPNRTHFVQ